MSSQQNEQNGNGNDPCVVDSDFSGSDLPLEKTFQPLRSIHQETQSHRILRRRGKPLDLDLSNSEDEDSQNNYNQEPLDVPIFNPPIESIHSQTEEDNEKKFYVKFRGKSFRHCRWMLEQEIVDYDPTIKNKLNRFIRDFDHNVSKKNNYFLNYDSGYLEIDRVLDSSEIFPVLHPKKGSQIKKKWSYNLIRVLNFLANFEYQGIFYGVEMLQMSETFVDFPEINNNLDFSVMINRVYLDYYDGVIPFWNDLILLFENYNTLNFSRSNNDQAIVLFRLKELSKLAFKQWKEQHEIDYDQLKKFFNAKYSEVSFQQFFRDFNNIFQLKAKSGGFQEALENYIENNKEFIQNIDEIKDLVENLKKKRKEIDQPQVTVNGEGEERSIEEEKYKEEFKNLIAELQLKINQNIEHFQTLFDQSKLPNLNQIFTKEIHTIEFFNDPFVLDWIEDEDVRNSLSIKNPHGKKYLVKWSQLSYIQCTWEEESFVKQSSDKIKDFKKFNRALLKEQRHEYQDRYMKNNELREIYSNQRKLSRQHPSHIHDLKRKVFGFKDIRDVKQYSHNNPPIYKESKFLRSYQLDSLNWMIKSWTKRVNIILADEMGLGKTIQAMAFINHLVKIEKLNGPFLVMAPLSTLQHWKRVFDEWSDLNSVLYYDSCGKKGREMCRKLEWYRNDVTSNGSLTQNYKIGKFHVLITSFEVFLQDFELVFQEIPFQHIIIDEAHRLKNKNAKIIKELRQLVCTRIFLLTGTPIQNNLTELWSLLNFIEPGTFMSLKDFQEEFDNLNNENLEKLKGKLEPYLLRRMKEDVESSIPPLQETIIDIELTNIQKMVYKTVYEKNKGTLQKGLGLKFVSMMNNLEMQLRKCCNHPFLLQGIKENIVGENPLIDYYFEKLLNSSGKMIFLHKMIQKFKEENKKILVFSQFTEMLKIMEEYLHFYKIRYEKIDGSTKAKDRQKAIDRFNKRKEIFEVFLLSTKAGGIGINLTSAKIVIIYDSDWNPQNDVQAIARAHRIGQTDEVKVFRLVSKKTYEAEMFERATKKRGLDQAIFLSGDFAQNKTDLVERDEMKKLKPEEIELLLKKGMLGLLEDQEQEQENQIFDEDINKIIEKSRVANYSFINGNYSFAKGNFNSNNSDNKVLLDDPDFWQKVFKDSDKPTSKILKEYEEKVKSGMFKLLTSQKELILKLADEVHQFLVNRVKNDDFSPDTESIFEEIFQKIQDNPDIKQPIEDIVIQLRKDLRKKSRRIKLIDEKYYKNFTKKKPTDVEKQVKNNQSSANESNAEGDIVLSDPDYSDHKDSKLKIKKFNCAICKLEKPNFTCKSICQNNYHIKCLNKFLKDNIAHLKTILPSQETEETELISSIEGECILCVSLVQQCFFCKDFGKIENQGKINQVREIPDDQFVYKCDQCSMFYHLKCLKSIEIAPTESIIICPVHYCHQCKEKGDSLFECQDCPISFHKKCMSKRNKIIKNFVIQCYNHKKSSKNNRSKKPSKENNEKFNDPLDKKKNKLQKNDSELPKKSVKKNKCDLLSYEDLHIDPPSKFDYAATSKPWCRFCGARFSKKFYESPLGPETLCDIHYKILRKQQLKLPDEAPKTPVKPEKNTELLYLNRNQQQLI